MNHVTNTIMIRTHNSSGSPKAFLQILLVYMICMLVVSYVREDDVRMFIAVLCVPCIENK